MSSEPLAAQAQSTQKTLDCSISGTASGPDAHAVVDAQVRLEAEGTPSLETKTDSKGGFTFRSLHPGTYAIVVQKSKLQTRASVTLSNPGDVRQLALVLTDKPQAQPPAASAAMEFSDQPNFTVAGVTDWTAVGGHGSDLILRTSEDLARETLALKPSTAVSSNSNSDKTKESEQHRMAAEQAEKSGDPLTAVRQFQQAAQLDPSEQNYFEWGSELLLHRAVWQAVEVFQNGSKEYPQSARLKTALGTALFSGARYDQAAEELCDASDLDPANAELYLFMGKIEIASPNPLPCVEAKLARFLKEQPQNSAANYLYAVALQKSHNPTSSQEAERLFSKAVELDPKCAEAYLQLGNIYASRNSYDYAARFYKSAIEADPKLADAHYRLAVAYEHSNQPDKAVTELKIHDDLDKQQSTEIERERHEVKQFQVLMKSNQEPAQQ